MYARQGNGYGHGLVIAAKAFMEGGFRELGVGDLREALVLRRAGLSQPLHVCYQPDVHSAPALAAAPDLQVVTCFTNTSALDRCHPRRVFWHASTWPPCCRKSWVSGSDLPDISGGRCASSFLLFPYLLRFLLARGYLCF
jgi:hypothetical protein